MINKIFKTGAALIGAAGAAAATASEIILYLISNGHADLSFIIDKTKTTEEEQRRDALCQRDSEWLMQQKTEEYYVESDEGYRLHATCLIAPGSTRMAFCIHGIQTSGIWEFATAARFFYENGISCFCIDQRSCGKSEGKYLTYGDRESGDCKIWLDFIARQFGDDMKIFVYGVSMGSATALLLNNHKLPSNVEYIVSDCGYTSVEKQLKNTFNSIKLPSGPFYFLYKCACRIHRIYNPDTVDVTAAVRKCSLPVIFIHGDKDAVVPPENVYTLYNACGTSKKLIIVKGAGHSQCFALSEAVRKAIISGLDS